MSEIQLTNPGGIECLRRIFGQFRRNINFDALLTAELRERCQTAEADVLIELASGHDLRPEKHTDFAETAKTYNGPALLQLTNGSWIMVMRSQQFIKEDNVAIFDPSCNKSLLVQKSQLAERAGSTVIIFRNLQEIDSHEQSALFCLCAIARHHNISMDLRRVMHDFAIDTEEPRLTLLREIADSYELKSRMCKMKFDKLIHLNQAYPAMAVKKNGKYVVICGVRPNEDETVDLVVLDPEKTSAESRFTFLNKEAAAEELSGQVMLLKRRYKLSDEDRPFSLAWFLPEFYKLRGIFAQIALTVAMITILSLIVPLFFQIVVDKVLINKSYNTLNVLGIGIIFTVIFNGFLDFLRSYFLLFATNKIDVATATKTFRHLMRLPVDFFERVPSGVPFRELVLYIP